jgi:hypothetical protein
LKCDSGVNDQINLFRQEIGDFADDISAQNVDEGVAAGGAENEAGPAEGGGDVHDGRSGGFADSVTTKRRMAAGFDSPALRCHQHSPDSKR